MYFASSLFHLVVENCMWECVLSVTPWLCWQNKKKKKWKNLLHPQAVPHAGQADVPLCHCVGVPEGVVSLVEGKRIVSWTSRHCCVIFFQVSVPLCCSYKLVWRHLHLMQHFCWLWNHWKIMVFSEGWNHFVSNMFANNSVILNYNTRSSESWWALWSEMQRRFPSSGMLETPVIRVKGKVNQWWMLFIKW